jgi:hypothetical protein
MQSQSVILLAEVRHNELQSEAARFRIVNQACADRPTAIEIIASAGRRFRIALASAARRLYVHGVSASSRGAGRPASPALHADPL